MQTTNLSLSAIVPALLLAAVVPTAAAIEEPAYTTLHESDGYEIRRYEAYLVAETVVEGEFGSAGNRGFRILADYIFGNNTASEKMAMTAPVETRPAGEKMAMTAPVQSRETSPGRWVYAFVMERKYTLDTLPRPNDPRVTIRRVSPRTVAVRRYSGFWSRERYEREETLLLGRLAEEGIPVTGAPMLARYNGPMTPWFLRRNEVVVPVDWEGALKRTAAVR